jgi:hypothetical protein
MIEPMQLPLLNPSWHLPVSSSQAYRLLHPHPGGCSFSAMLLGHTTLLDGRILVLLSFLADTLSLFPHLIWLLLAASQACH